MAGSFDTLPELTELDDADLAFVRDTSTGNDSKVTRRNILDKVDSISGSKTASGTLTLKSTINATKGKIIFGTSVYDEANNRLGVANSTPTEALDVTGNATISGDLTVSGGISNVSYSNKTSSYTILDTDSEAIYYVDTTTADVTITMPLLANNYGKSIKILHARGGTNKVIVAPNATDANKLTNDGLNAIWLPKVGDYIELQANNIPSAIFWQSINERISSQLRLDTNNGFGSTDNKIPKYTNSREDFGNMFSHNHGAYGTAGLEITINRSGKYSFSISHDANAVSAVGLSKNSSQLTLGVVSINVQDRLNVSSISVATQMDSNSWSGYLNKNDVVRPHTEGAAVNLAARHNFTVTYLGN